MKRGLARYAADHTFVQLYYESTLISKTDLSQFF